MRLWPQHRRRRRSSWRRQVQRRAQVQRHHTGSQLSRCRRLPRRRRLSSVSPRRPHWRRSVPQMMQKKRSGAPWPSCERPSAELVGYRRSEQSVRSFTPLSRNLPASCRMTLCHPSSLVRKLRTNRRPHPAHPLRARCVHIFLRDVRQPEHVAHCPCRSQALPRGSPQGSRPALLPR